MTDYEQTSWVQTTELDEATAVLSHLMEERKKAVKAVSTANDKLDEADERLRQQQHVVDLLQSKMPPAEPAPVEGEAEDVEDGEIVDESRQIEGDTLDPATGEVTSRAERGEGTVSVWWPQAGEPVMTDVGPTTQYAEFVVDYFHSGASLAHETDLNHWCVVAVGDGRARELHAQVAPEDHGLEFAVVYGTAADLEAELRTCANCGIGAGDCAMTLENLTDGTGCGGNGWQPVNDDAAEAEYDQNAEAEAQAQEAQAA